MSRWLNSVNNLLDKLDDRVESVRENVGELVQDVLLESGESYDDDDDDDDDDEEEDSDDAGADADAEEQQQEGDEYYTTESDDGIEEEEIELVPATPPTQRQEQPLFKDSPQAAPRSAPLQPAAPQPSPVARTPMQPTQQQQKQQQKETPGRNLSQPPPQQPTPSTGAQPPVSAPSSNNNQTTTTETTTTSARLPPSSGNNHVNTHKRRTAHAPPSSGMAAAAAAPPSKQVMAELKQLRKQHLQLQQQLQATQKELKATQTELNQAASMVQRERDALQQEQEEWEHEHDQEIQDIQATHAKETANLKAMHAKEVKALQARLSQEQSQRQQEGATNSQELEAVLQREQDAVAEIAELNHQITALQTTVDQLTDTQSALQLQLEHARDTQATAVERERQAEAQLDAALEQHKHQLTLRQHREAALEQQVADLQHQIILVTSNTATPRTTTTTTSSMGGGYYDDPNNNNNNHAAGQYKEQWETAREEVETLQTQLTLEQQQCEALRRELQDLSQERNQEAAVHQQRQRELDQQLVDYAATIAALEERTNANQNYNTNNSMHDTMDGTDANDIQRLQRQIEDGKTQIQRLSEQVMRQQGQAELQKSELMALKGRLQLALNRAEEAEKMASASTTYQSGNSGMDSDYQMRRRVKGGSRHRHHGGRSSITVRSIRSALGLGPGAMEGLGKTLDAVDVFMIDTGNVFRHEPLARLAFFVYFSMLHLWCFCLVVFHATETSSYHHHSVHGVASLRGAGGLGGVNDPAELIGVPAAGGGN